MRITTKDVQKLIERVNDQGLSISLSGAYGGYKIEDNDYNDVLNSGYIRLTDLYNRLDTFYRGLTYKQRHYMQ